MEPISNADRLALLLRQKLEERANASGNSSKSRGVGAPLQGAGVRAMAAVEDKDGRALRRAVIQQILADQLGPSLVNDAQFQQIVVRVSDTIEADPEAAQLLSRAIEELKRA